MGTWCVCASCLSEQAMYLCIIHFRGCEDPISCFICGRFILNEHLANRWFSTAGNDDSSYRQIPTP